MSYTTESHFFGANICMKKMKKFKPFKPVHIGLREETPWHYPVKLRAS